MTVRVRAFTDGGYQKDILVFDDEQTRMTHGAVEETLEGIRIDPKQYPEAAYFTIVVDRHDKPRR
jgi:hypothetical protein